MTATDDCRPEREAVITAASGDVARPRERLMSLDALRGFDMLWIIGAGSIVKALESMRQDRYTSSLATQLQHVNWEGFHFYDLKSILRLNGLGSNDRSISLAFWLTSHSDSVM